MTRISYELLGKILRERFERRRRKEEEMGIERGGYSIRLGTTQTGMNGQ